MQKQPLGLRLHLPKRDAVDISKMQISRLFLQFKSSDLNPMSYSNISQNMFPFSPPYFF